MIKTSLLTCVLLIAMSTFPVVALPGQSDKSERTWLLGHSFFPAKTLYFRLNEFTTMGVNRPLSEGRILDFKGYFYEAGSPVFYETISLFKAKTRSEKDCFDALELGATEGNYTPILWMYSSQFDEGRGFNEVFPECTQDAGINFLQRDSEVVRKTLGLVYGQQHAILKDLKESKMTHRGFQRFFLEYDSNLNTYHKRLIQAGPIEFRIYQGQKFDYVATPNTLSVVLNTKKGNWNNWNKLATYWKNEENLFNKLKGEEAKSVPYSL